MSGSAIGGLLELSPDPILVADESGSIREANAGAESLLGCDADALVGMALADVIRIPATVEGDPLGEGPPVGEVRRLGDDGAVYAECPDGRAVPVAVSLSVRDLDGDRHLIAALRPAADAGTVDVSEAHYRRLLEFSPAPICIYDAEGVLRYANRAAADLHEVDSPADLVGVHGSEFIHPDERESAAGDVGRVAEDGEAVFESGFSTAERGTGLGLAIVDEVAEAHGWDVTLTESTEGGARFEFACA